MITEYIYANFDFSEKDTCTCNVYCDGEVVGGGPMLFKSGIYLYKFNVTRAGSYYAVCVATDKASYKSYKDYSFTIFEEAVPNIIELSTTELKLKQIQDKLGDNYNQSLEAMLRELTSYETGTTPLPHLMPITCLNTALTCCEGNNSLLVDGMGCGITGAKIVFTNQESEEETICYSVNGYWGTYLKYGSYAITITFDKFFFEDVITV